MTRLSPPVSGPSGGVGYRFPHPRFAIFAHRVVKTQIVRRNPLPPPKREASKMNETQSQIEALKKLRQGAVAFLCGVSSRSIRSARGLKRNLDGTYDARQVLLWAANRPAYLLEALQAEAETLERGLSELMHNA